MKDQNLPNIFKAADNASEKAQKAQLRLTKVELFTSIIGAFISVISYHFANYRKALVLIAIIFLLIALFITIAKRFKNYGKSWYEGRALAESVKTLTWRFVCKAEDFSKDDKLSTQKFIARMSELKDGFKSLIPELDATLLATPSISEEMLNIRTQNLEERVKAYKDFRILPQITWYKSKASLNKSIGLTFFWIQIGFQLLSIVIGVILLSIEYHNLSIIGVTTTISVSILSWVQMKRYYDLNTAYTATTMELSKIRDLFSTIETEEQFSQFVLDSENAISREHTTWLAQRRT